MQPSPQTKRVPDPDSPNKQPGLELVRTVPTDNVLYDYSGLMSNPYVRPWDDAISRDDWAWDNPEELAEIIDYEFS